MARDGRSIAATIRRQIGNSSLMAAGARDFVFDKHGTLTFKVTIRRGQKHWIKVKYNSGSDTYTVELLHAKRGSYEAFPQQEAHMVYADQLSGIVYDFTNKPIRPSRAPRKRNPGRRRAWRPREAAGDYGFEARAEAIRRKKKITYNDAAILIAAEAKALGYEVSTGGRNIYIGETGARRLVLTPQSEHVQQAGSRETHSLWLKDRREWSRSPSAVQKLIEKIVGRL